MWVAGCATGEEAYSLAILLKEHADRLDLAPPIQILASDPSERAFNLARAGLYPEGIAADVSEARLEKHFTKEGAGYRVRPALREIVLFASHDLLSDPPFSRVDLVVCRNVLIYLQRDAQRRVLELFHYALKEGGHLFLGSAEAAGVAEDLFEPVDAAHRVYRRRSVPRISPPLLPLRRRTSDAAGSNDAAEAGEAGSLSMLHQRLLEAYAPPSLVVNDDYEVVHLSERVGRYLQLGPGQPTMMLLDMVEGELRLELRRVLSAAFRKGESTVAGPVLARIGGRSVVLRLAVRPLVADAGPHHALVVFEEVPSQVPSAPSAPVSPVDLENERLRQQLQAVADDYERTVQQYQAANEELQSINEEQRATGEELETSKEEIESINEELRTLNQEYRSKIEELAQLNADLRNLMDSTDVATIFLARDLVIRRFTPRVTEWFNFRPGDTGRRIDEVTHRLEYADLVGDAKIVLASLSRVEREVAAEGGRWVTVRMAPYRSLDDRIDGVVVTLIDATVRKQHEMEREKLLRDAQEADALKSNFLGILSHDFRTPLNGLLGYTDLLRHGVAGPLTPKQGAYLDRVRSVATQLTGMVEELLAYAKVEGGGVPVTVAPLDPAEAAREAIEVVQTIADAKGILLASDLAQDLPPIETDALKLRQILVNLLGNAIAFTDGGRVALRVVRTAGGISFAVEDTGMGIAPEHKERVFDRFWQVDPSPASGRAGSGLGLTAAREYARLLGGDLTVESELGKGSVFRLQLPLVPPRPKRR